MSNLAIVLTRLNVSYSLDVCNTGHVLSNSTRVSISASLVEEMSSNSSKGIRILEWLYIISTRQTRLVKAVSISLGDKSLGIIVQRGL